MLSDLPLDLQRRVLCFLGARSLARAACVSRTLRLLVDDTPLKPVMTSRTRMMVWLLRPPVASRVVALTARRCMWGRCTFLCGFPALERLVISFGHVYAGMFRWLPPTLRHLDVHRVTCDDEDVFYMSRVCHLTRLHTLKLTFTRRWVAVVIDSLDALSLRVLSVRLAQRIAVRSTLMIAEVQLHAIKELVCSEAVHTETLDLACDREHIVASLAITPHSASSLRCLRLACPECSVVPNLVHMTALRDLRIRFDSLVMPMYTLASLRHLRTLVIETKYGLAIQNLAKKLPPTVTIQAYVGGAPVHPTLFK